MRSHITIDRRSLALARSIVALIDSDPDHAGLNRARVTCERWLGLPGMTAAMEEWRVILKGDWENVRLVLLDDSERGARLRQSSPFVGILDRGERRAIWKEFRRHDATSA